MRDSPNSGFTLLEVLVAVTITALCVALVSVSMGTVFGNHERARDHIQAQQALSQSVEKIREFLQAAYFSPHPVNQLDNPFQTLDSDRMSEPYDAITFTTIANRSYRIDAKEAEIAEITLFTIEEPEELLVDGRRMELRRLRVRIGGEINDRFEVEGGEVYTLAEHVTTFLLDYLDQDGEWKSEWNAFDHANQLPCAVRVTLGVRTEKLGEQMALFMVPLELSNLPCVFDQESIFEEELE